MTRTVSLSRNLSSSARTSPWKSGLGNPSAINCTGPMAMAVPFLDRVRVSGRRTPDDPPTYAGDVDTPPEIHCSDRAGHPHHTIRVRRSAIPVHGRRSPVSGGYPEGGWWGEFRCLPGTVGRTG